MWICPDCKTWHLEPDGLRNTESVPYGEGSASYDYYEPVCPDCGSRDILEVEPIEADPDSSLVQFVDEDSYLELMDRRDAGERFPWLRIFCYIDGRFHSYYGPLDSTKVSNDYFVAEQHTKYGPQPSEQKGRSTWHGSY